MRRELITKTFFRLSGKSALAPAYLLSGPDSEPKHKIAKELCLYLNCQSDNKPCLTCLNCKWIIAGTHPNTPLYLKPQEESKKPVIKIEDCETLQNQLAKADNCHRVVIIEDASSGCFKTDTANRLLKTIEEPNTNTVFLLFAADKELVLTTIVSRCQEIYVSPESQEETKLSEAAQELYDKHASNLINCNSKLDLMQIATSLQASDREPLIEFFEAISNDYARVLNTAPLELAQKIEAIETIKNDIRSFVKADMAIYHALK